MLNRHRSSDLASAFLRAVCLVAAITLTSCGTEVDPKPTTDSQANARAGIPEESWLKPWTWRNDEKVIQIQQRSEEVRRKLVLAAAAPLSLMAIAAVLLAAFGPGWAERARHWFSRRFAIPPDTQRMYATGGLIVFVVLSILLALASQFPKEAVQPIAILCAGAAIIFFRRLLPLIGTPEVAKAKLALAQLKPLVFLVIVILVAMWMLSTLRMI